MKRFEILNQSGAPQTVNGVTLTPQSQAFVLRLPWAGLVYHRPAAVLVTRDGGTERLPIRDLTRWAYLGIAAWVLVFIIGTLRERMNNE